MNLNSQYTYDPPQPDNPTDSERYVLSQYALAQKGWPEDQGAILELMSPPLPITRYARPGECKGLKVGVIGGGLAGLAAAYELRKLGFDITVYDALEDRVGGRIYTYYFNKSRDLYHEFGAMRIPVTHETVWHYLNLFNLPTRPFIQYNPNSFIYIKNTRVRNDRDGLNVMRYIYPHYDLSNWEKTVNWQRLFDLGLDSHIRSAASEERLEIIQTKPYYSPKVLQWSDNTNIRMMQAAGLSQAAINLVSNFHPLLVGNLYNSYIDYVQEEYPASTTFEYEIPGGLVKLPMAFYNSLMSTHPYPEIDSACAGKVSYHRGCWVDGIHLDGGKVRLQYRSVKSTQHTTEAFDFIVCAIPFSTLRGLDIDPLFSNIKMRAIREVNYTPAQKTMILCRERFWEKEGIVGGGSFTDLPLSSIWYPSDHAEYLNSERIQSGILPTNDPGVMLASYNFNLETTRLSNQPAESLVEQVKQQLTAVHGLPPRYLDNAIQGFKLVNWNQEPAFRGALSFFSPEQKRIFSYGMTLPEYDGRVFFAGEHISPVHRWIQGSLQTGMQAANDLAAACLKK